MRSKPNANTDRNANPDTTSTPTPTPGTFPTPNAYSDADTQTSVTGVTVWRSTTVHDEGQAKEKLTAFLRASILPRCQGMCHPRKLHPANFSGRRTHFATGSQVTDRQHTQSRPAVIIFMFRSPALGPAAPSFSESSKAWLTRSG